MKNKNQLNTKGSKVLFIILSSLLFMYVCVQSAPRTVSDDYAETNSEHATLYGDGEYSFNSDNYIVYYNLDNSFVDEESNEGEYGYQGFDLEYENQELILFLEVTDMDYISYRDFYKGEKEYFTRKSKYGQKTFYRFEEVNKNRNYTYIDYYSINLTKGYLLHVSLKKPSTIETNFEIEKVLSSIRVEKR